LTYNKTTWKDRQVEFPNRYTMIDNGDGTYTLTPAPGTVTAEGTPISATNQNKLETQYDEVKAEVEKIDGTSLIKPDWSNVKNSAHKSTHATGGTDALTPADIGAESKADADAHKAESATLTQKGHVQLNNATDSTDETTAATPSAVKVAIDLLEFNDLYGGV
jgi:phage-related tail fiber protein